MRFEIRRKTYPFNDAPILNGVNQGYEAVVFDELPMGYGPQRAVSRHAKALDAAIAAATEAHRLNHSGHPGTQAGVRGFWAGERPIGVMKRMMTVSYRARD